MKIAVTTGGEELNSEMDSRFGRTKGFIIYDVESGEYVYKTNKQNLQAAHGAGIQTAKNVIDAGATVLISGNVGPKAFATLQAASIDIYTTEAGTVSQAIEDFRSGKLMKAQGANAESHW